MNFTEWFPECISPTHVGVYERGTPNTRFPYPYCFWDGRAWLGIGKTPDEALELAVDGYQASSFAGMAWRGLAEKP